MPRILRILNRLIIGGPSLNACYLTKYMAPEWETMLVIGGKDDHEQEATHLTERLGIEPVEIPVMKRAIDLRADRAAYLQVKELIQKFKPDVVHTHAAKSGAIGRLAAHACKVPVVVHTFHGHVFHSYFGKLKSNAFVQIERYLARRSSGIIAISDIQKHELSDTYKICPADKIDVIPLGFDLDHFNQDVEAKRNSFRMRYGIKENEVAIGIVGRIVSVKNHQLFVDAVAKMRNEAVYPLRFIIVGDGDMRVDMEQGFRKAGIEYAYFPDNPSPAQAICTSWLTAMDEVFAGLDIVALTSHNEGTPVSLIEAQASGRPVVSTNVGGVADIVANGQTGYVVPPGDVAAFAAALLRLADDKLMRRAFGNSGKLAVMKRFSYQRLVRDMDQYYRRLLASSNQKF
ncbi:MAG: glycosyltransferase [Bacteroidetes bacterium]|nr:glycosyltransferase [Bacteroidota bacterium]